ncbi:FAD/FMN dependent oxidoreductase [Spironucleus salmonicida]|uniref:FAD/FMN dependent oxidoreductase n=1 Tax=Spironucleus salmonicida TaxID=348837 RepID=V6LG63_9EUKA|nr:FAD/FMN dependent oxidoreductase [Spironucleus salmonicida]|eukprot:EST43278.1 FAD/FMN dependent oxidoreductase [Spironucleus salmonicida]
MALNLKNLIIQNPYYKSATAMKLCDYATGIPLEEMYTYYADLARGQIGIIALDHMYVERRGHAGHSQVGIDSDDKIKYHERLVKCIKAVDPKTQVFCQLAHAGQHSQEENKLDYNTCSAETLYDIIKAFGDAAMRAKAAGYDGVQIHGAHTYLVSQSISDAYNKRTDEFNPQDFKFLRLVLENVRKAGIVSGIKIQTNDWIDGCGVNPEFAVKIISSLDFDFVEVSGGGWGKENKLATIRPVQDKFYYKEAVELLNKEKHMESQFIIATGGFDTKEDAKEAFDLGCKMVGFARKFIRNPTFLIKDDKECDKCNKCLRNEFSYCVIKD